MSIYNAFKDIRYTIRDELINKKNRKRLINRNISLIASDCIGGVMAHELGLRYNSPTINLLFMAEDYIKFISNPKRYLDCNMRLITSDEYNYPLVELNDIKLHLVHYSTIEEAQVAWDRRKKRINWENMYYIMTDRNNCSEGVIQEFDSLPYKNKVIFVHKKEWEERYKAAYFVKGFEKDKEVGTMTAFTSVISIIRNYDQFDYVNWINEK